MDKETSYIIIGTKNLLNRRKKKLKVNQMFNRPIFSKLWVN